MRRLLICSLTCVLSGCLLIACQRDDGLRAGNEEGSGTYQPRSVPPKAEVLDNQGNQEIRGELSRVEVPRKTFSVRIENGIEQTFKFDDQTLVTGLDSPPVQTPARAGATAIRVRDLVGKEGSEVIIQWKPDGDAAKMATGVAVTQIITKKPTRKGARKR